MHLCIPYQQQYKQRLPFKNEGKGEGEKRVRMHFHAERGVERHFVAALQALPARPSDGGGRMKIKKKATHIMGTSRDSYLLFAGLLTRSHYASARYYDRLS